MYAAGALCARARGRALNLSHAARAPAAGTYGGALLLAMGAGRVVGSGDAMAWSRPVMSAAPTDSA